MPYKKTRRPAGRPPSRGEPFVGFGLDEAHAPQWTVNVPEWWIAMADLEAEMIVSGRWRHGSLRDLARHFTAARGGGKSPAAVTKVRSDPRYQAHRAGRIRALRLIQAQDARDPERAAADRAEHRAAIEAAWREAEAKERE